MNIRFQKIKQEFNDICKNRNIPGEMKNRIQCLNLQIVRIEKYPMHSEETDEMLRYCQELNNCLLEPDGVEIAKCIEDIENCVIGILGKDLCTMNSFQGILLRSRAESVNQSLISIFPKFVCICLMKFFTANRTSFLDFQGVFSKVLEKFQITDCEFIRKVIKFHLCDNFPQVASNPEVNLSRLMVLINQFCGTIKDYLFYVKISKIYGEVFENLYQEYCYNKEIRLRFTRKNPNYNGETEINFDDYYDIGPTGLKNAEKYRGDRMVIIGNHPKADIVLPAEDKSVEPVMLLIFNSKKNYYIVDCAEKAPSSIKLVNFYPHKLREKMLLNLSGTILVAIQKIEFFQVDENEEENYFEDQVEIHSTLHLNFINGPYKNEDIKVSTHEIGVQELKVDHILGRGGDGISVDLFIPSGWIVSKCQLCFEYTQTNVWEVKDDVSNNGSYVLMKNYSEHIQNSESKPIRMFCKRNGRISHATIYMAGYVMYIHKL